MAELNLSQIEENLNKVFTEYGERKLVFWFDENQEFSEEITNLNLVNAEIYYLEKDEQFKTKVYLEIDHPEQHFLIYAPFRSLSESDEENHLLGMLNYSTIFHADRIAIIMEQLAIPEHFHDVVAKYGNFFGAKARIERFASLKPSQFKTTEAVELTILATIVKATDIRIESVLQTLLVQGDLVNNNLMADISKYGLEKRFWEFIQLYFGYQHQEPTLQKLVIAFFANTFYQQIGDDSLPKSLKDYQVGYKTGTITTFMDQFMNDKRYVANFDRLSAEVFQIINGKNLLKTIKIDDLIESDVFKEIDVMILEWLKEQLVSQDLSTKLAHKELLEVIHLRKYSHFSQVVFADYELLKHAWYLVNLEEQLGQLTSENITSDYQKEQYFVDTHYRKYIWNLDRVAESEEYHALTTLVENNYGTYLDQLALLWNEAQSVETLPKTADFYQQYVANRKLKTVVIISDAFRYEAAKDLQKKLNRDPKNTTHLSAQLSPMPSVTEFGKAALLPNQHITYVEGKVLVDGKKTQGTVNREKVLRGAVEESVAVSYETVTENKIGKGLRDLFNGQEVIYIYHDQIDRTGDHGQEHQVFDAVAKAIKELESLVRFISNGASIYRFIITADHGFIYRRKSVEESDKIENPSTDKEHDRVERRFIISEKNYQAHGIGSISLGESLNNTDQRYVNYPLTTSIFKKAGGGQNYVHGGATIQEMLAPVLEVNVSRRSAAKTTVDVELMSSRKKITGLSTVLEFYQKDQVNDSFMKGPYELYFESQDGQRVSNSHLYMADSKSDNFAERFSKFTFEFINRHYSVTDTYYLVVYNSETSVEHKRYEFVIDNPFSGNFSFDL